MAGVISQISYLIPAVSKYIDVTKPPLPGVLKAAERRCCSREGAGDKAGTLRTGQTLPARATLRLEHRVNLSCYHQPLTTQFPGKLWQYCPGNLA